MVDTLLLHLNRTLQDHVNGVATTRLEGCRKRSRHTMECDRLTSALPHCHRAVQFWQDVLPTIEQYSLLQNVPIRWRLHDDASEQTQFIHALIRRFFFSQRMNEREKKTAVVIHEIWRVGEKYSPGFLTREFPTLNFVLSNNTGTNPTTTTTTTGSSHHQTSPPSNGGIRETTTTVPPPQTSTTEVTTEDDMTPEKSHNATVPMITGGGAHGSIYQRRAQFRMAIAGFQGKPSRPVPPEVIQDIQDQLHETVRHLIDLTVDPSDRLRRYRAVTRVHILTLMRSIGNNRYSRWYRESHYIHYPGWGSCA